MIAVDWGTSSLRAYRLDEAGRIRARREAPAGIMTVAAGGFAAVLEAQLGDWIDDTPIMMSGMIGSRQGWLEVPYAECPAGAADIARGLRPIVWNAGRRRGWIAPGLSCRDAAGVPDVMRGEETQIIGALADLPEGDATICLPGTHSKWVSWRDGRIVSIATAMTGEIFAVLRRHSILGRLMSETDNGHDAAAFTAGLRRAEEGGGLLHHLFGARTRGLFGDVAEYALPSYLSGILIGHEIAALAPPAGVVHLIGAPSLVALYREALAARGCNSRMLDGDSVAHGLFLLASHLPTGEADV
jgi:2-dehydro-3-deoxygalactonokinase